MPEVGGVFAKATELGLRQVGTHLAVNATEEIFEVKEAIIDRCAVVPRGSGYLPLGRLLRNILRVAVGRRVEHDGRILHRRGDGGGRGWLVGREGDRKVVDDALRLGFAVGAVANRIAAEANAGDRAITHIRIYIGAHKAITGFGDQGFVKILGDRGVKGFHITTAGGRVDIGVVMIARHATVVVV